MIFSGERTSLFVKNKKCIINSDLDGLLSGMILHHFLDWKIVGFSSCSGKEDDNLWLFNRDEKLDECVFVDLPVYLKDYSTIDQHFIAFDHTFIESYENDENKINPNIIRKRVLKTNDGTSEYTLKYPFGTVHFILAILENMGIIHGNISFDFKKRIDDFYSSDLILRADRVIGNTKSYTENCVDWIEWLKKIGGKNTESLFNIVQNELLFGIVNEIKVESKMLQLGCKGKDGDCSNMLRNKDYESLNQYFNFLASAMDMEPIPVKELIDFGSLKGMRFEVNEDNFESLKKESLKSNVFSFAFVTKRMLSITYFLEVKDNE